MLSDRIAIRRASPFSYPHMGSSKAARLPSLSHLAIGGPSPSKRARSIEQLEQEIYDALLANPEVVGLFENDDLIEQVIRQAVAALEDDCCDVVYFCPLNRATRRVCDSDDFWKALCVLRHWAKDVRGASPAGSSAPQATWKARYIAMCLWPRRLFFERVWRARTGNRLASLAITPDGQRIVVGTIDHRVRMWELTTGELVWCTHALVGHTRRVNSVAVTPDGKHVISGSSDNTIRVWELTTGEEVRTLVGHTGAVLSVAVTPDGARIVSGSDDKTIRVWEPTTGEEVRTLVRHTETVNSVAVTPDGQRIVSGSADQTIRVWKLAADEVHTLVGHAGGVNAVAVTPDGQRIVSCAADQTIRVWKLMTGELEVLMHAETAQPDGHENSVLSVTVTPDGQRIVSGGAFEIGWAGMRPLWGTLQVWELTTGKAVRSLVGHESDVGSVAVTPDGQRVVSVSCDDTIRVWGVR
jgi:WD40 repeat protein